MYTIPELPTLTGTEGQIKYAEDIRQGYTRIIQGLLPDGTPSGGRSFRDRVYDVLARATGTRREALMSEATDSHIQGVINNILGQKDAAKVIDLNKHSFLLVDRVAFAVQNRLEKEQDAGQ